MSGVISPPFDKVLQYGQGSLSISSNNVQIPINPTGYLGWELLAYGTTNNGVAGYTELDIRCNNLSTNIYIFGVERSTNGVLTTVAPAAANNAIRSFALAGSNVANVGTSIRIRSMTPSMSNQQVLDIEVIGSIPQGNYIRDRIVASVNLGAALNEIDLVLPTEFFSAFNFKYALMGIGKI